MAPDFGLGKVYVVLNTVNAIKYVGSTVRTLAQRMAQHRMQAQGNDGRPLYGAMRELGVDKFYIELLADFPCERREQLNAEEGRRIRELGTLAPNGYNLLVAGRSKNDYYTDNKVAILAKVSAHYEVNKEAINHRRKHTYNVANKEAIKLRGQAYYAAHAEEIKVKQRARDAAKKAAAAQAPVAPAEPVAN